MKYSYPRHQGPLHISSAINDILYRVVRSKFERDIRDPLIPNLKATRDFLQKKEVLRPFASGGNY